MSTTSQSGSGEHPNPRRVMANRTAASSLTEFIDRYRLPGECDECATNAAALATGYPDHVDEACATEGCPNYSADYAAHLADIEAMYERMTQTGGSS